jgi:antitoxin VapB
MGVGAKSLNIKNKETYRLVQELAELTGENMTAAVTSAVKDRLVQLRNYPKPSRLERMMAISNKTAALFKEPWKSIDHGEFLYDEKGLPKSDR